MPEMALGSYRSRTLRFARRLGGGVVGGRTIVLPAELVELGERRSGAAAFEEAGYPLQGRSKVVVAIVGSPPPAP